jgi:hypothetical protein
MTAAVVLDQLCTFFGGAYDPDTRTYRDPQVAGLGAVRRAFPKRDDKIYYTLGATTDHGCVMVVQLRHGDERRIAVGGATSGVKQCRYLAELHCFIRSTAAYAEDAYDYACDLREAIIARVHGDRTCGSGGIEVGGFQVGEGDSPRFEWDLPPAETHAELTKLYLHIAFDVLEYVQA